VLLREADPECGDEHRTQMIRDRSADEVCDERVGTERQMCPMALD